ncbi:MAG: MASE1 domain-containing protein, partial [Dongiaceae bacterium]
MSGIGGIRSNGISGEPSEKPAGDLSGYGWRSEVWLPFLLTYVLYLVGFRIGQMLALPGSISPVWPASGLALAMVLQFGNRVGFAIFAACLTGQLLWQHLGIPIWLASIIPLGATAEPLLAAYLLRRFSAFDPALPRFRDIVALILLGAPVSTLLNSLYTVAALAAVGSIPWPNYTVTATVFWFGNAGGVLMMSTAMLVWLRPATRGRFTSAALIETGIILALLSAIILGMPHIDLFQPPASQDPVAFLCFPLIAWASIRLELRLSTLITLLVAAETIIAARLGTGVFSAAGPDVALFFIQLFILSLNVTNQLLGSLARQKYSAEELLRDREEFLSLAVHGGNDGLFDFRRPSRNLWLSARWKAQLGYDDGELANSVETWEQLIVPEDREKALAQFQVIDQSGTMQSESLLRFRHKKGHVVHILCRLSVR